MKFKFLKMVATSLVFAVSGLANAGLITVEGDQLDSSNGFPFGWGSWGPHMGFVYQNIDSFDLKSGDVIAFDVSSMNNVDFDIDLSIGHASSNGGWDVDGSGFTSIGNLSNTKGDNIAGNYDLAFIINGDYSFSGGGLILDFGLNHTDNNSQQLGFRNSSSSDTSGLFVGRYYFANSVGDYSSRDFGSVGNFQIRTTDVPEPSTLAIFALGMIGLASRRFKKQS